MPVPLTINALAEHYEVSFTPVRKALTELAEQGLLIKTPNGRLTRAKPCESESTGQFQAPDLPAPTRALYDIIWNDLMDLSLQGESVYLREEVTAEKYGHSRSAIRNIFHRLAGSGLLDHIPRRGWKLRAFRQEDLRSFNETREVLELKALELARPHLVDSELQTILDGNRLPEAEGEMPVLDNSLHSYFINKSGNFYIKDFFERQGSYFSMLFRKEVNILYRKKSENRKIAIQAVSEHRDILRALLEKDWREASKVLSRHIRFSGRSF